MTSGQARQLSRVLTIGVVALAVIYLLLLAGFGRGTPGSGQVQPDALPPLSLTEADVDVPGLDRFQDVVERPLFSTTRRPEPKEAPPEPEPVKEPEPEPPSAPLNVALTGIIHTPNARIALVRDNSTGRSLNLREKQPLPGDQGGWQVKTIEPRRIVFTDTGSGSDTVLDLAIGAGSMVPTPVAAASGSGSGNRRNRQGNRQQGAPPAAPAQPDAEAKPENDEVAQRAAEIRRRIEERRAQLRREAEQKQ